MATLPPPPLPHGLSGLFKGLCPRMELRIDVQRPDETIESELDTLHRRLHTAADPLGACTTLPSQSRNRPLSG